MNITTDKNYNIALEYNEKSLCFVNAHFKKDFEMFGYKQYTYLKEFQDCYLLDKVKKKVEYHKEITLANGHIKYLHSKLKKYDEIINILLESHENNSNCKEIICLKQELNKTKKDINNMNEKRKEDNLCIKEKIKENLITNKVTCQNCGFVLFNDLAYGCHKRSCII
jgi:predicted Zn-ribbon and HTH transcriptional regulator